MEGIEGLKGNQDMGGRKGEERGPLRYHKGVAFIRKAVLLSGSKLSMLAIHLNRYLLYFYGRANRLASKNLGADKEFASFASLLAVLPPFSLFSTALCI